MGSRQSANRQKKCLTLGEIIPRIQRRSGLAWIELVGPAFADGSVCLGVGPASELRVVAANEVTQQELMAREEHVLSIWNSRAKARGEKTADRLVCWVNTEFFQGRAEAAHRRIRKTPFQLEASRTRREQQLAPFLRTARDEIATKVSNSEVREALIALRARGLQEADAERREGIPDDQGRTGTGGEG
jgi:hypothetical protein